MLADIIPPTIMDLRLFVGFAFMAVDNTFGKTGTELLFRFIRERIASGILRCIDLVFPRMDGVDFSDIVTSREIPRAESLYNSHNIQFRVIQ
jgi:hypothetical protein